LHPGLTSYVEGDLPASITGSGLDLSVQPGTGYGLYSLLVSGNGFMWRFPMIFSPAPMSGKSRLS
jgi:hypothetical protein